MKKRPLKKKPSEYPLFSFRISIQDKEEINSLLKEIHELANRALKSDQKRIKKNEILVSGLLHSLRRMKREYKSNV